MKLVFGWGVKSLYLIAAAVILSSCSFFSGGFSGRLKSGDPLHIRLTIEDEKDHSLLLYGRLIVYPEQKVALFYFVNTQARTSPTAEPFKKGFGMFGDPLKEITGKGHDFSLKLSPSALSRWIDLLEGEDFFVEDSLFLKGARYQYPEGISLFPGAQAVEYAFLAGTAERGSEYLAEVDRLYRGETILLNLFWQLPRKFKVIDSESRMKLIHSLVETDLSSDQLRSLFAAFAGDHPLGMVVLEAPMELGTLNGQKVLIYKKDHPELLFQEFEKNIAQKVDGFPVQVLNGTEINRLASKVKDLIHNRGVRVLNTDNYKDKNFPHSLAIEHSGDFRKARLLMELLALPPEQVFFRRRAVDLQATIIMGNDFNVKNLLKQ